MIKGFGKVHPRSDAAVQPDPDADYKVIVDVVHGSKDRHKVPGSLQRLAHIVNLLGFAGVPASHVHIVAVLEGEAGYAAASNAYYRKLFKTDNPNLPILHPLQQAACNCWPAARRWRKTNSAAGTSVRTSRCRCRP